MKKPMMMTTLMAFSFLMFAMPAFAGSDNKSEAQASREASTNKAALEDARSAATTSCKQKNRDAVCKAAGHKKGSKAMNKCKNGLKKKGAVVEKIASRCKRKYKVGKAHVKKCYYRVRCWHK